MSDIKKLEIIGTIKDGITIGTKNIGPILVNLILWILTCWIPYLNVGTTIGLVIGIVKKASKDEPIPMTEIFNPIYRKYMGEFFLVCGLVGIGVGIATVFMIIPGIVIGIAWCFATLITIDKNKNPTEALYLSNKATYGNKWRIFGIYFLVILAFGILIAVLSFIPVVGIILGIAVMLFMNFVIIGIMASMYRQLTGDIA